MSIPSNDNYVNVIAGIEMLNYFTSPLPLFTISVYNNYDPNDAFFLTVFIFFSSAVILNIIKLIYEVNVKLIFSVHFFCLFNECLNILLLVFTCFYLTSATFKGFDLMDKKHHSHLSLMSIRKYLVVIISFTMLCIPFRLLSFISWYKILSKPVVKFMGVIFRMLPGILISILVIGTILYSFSLMNYALYSQHFYQFSSIYNTFLALFNLQVILELLDENSGVYYSINNSPYYVFMNIFQLIILFLLLIILIGTFSYLFKRASFLEEEKLGNEVMDKLNEIEEKLTKGKTSIDNDLKNLKKQVLWLNFSNKNELYNQHSSKNNLLLFKTSNQVIAFLKYLFAIKPELQFKNLYNKFGILIEVKNEKMVLKENELEQISLLVDWLNFVGCKIPVMFYSQILLEKTIIMKFHATYKYINFITNLPDIECFIKASVKVEYSIWHVEHFSILCKRKSRVSNTMLLQQQNNNLNTNLSMNNGNNNNIFPNNCSSPRNNSILSIQPGVKNYV